MRDSGAVWLANETPEAIPGLGFAPRRPGEFLLARDGWPIAWTDPHGTWVNWLGA